NASAPRAGHVNQRKRSARAPQPTQALRAGASTSAIAPHGHLRQRNRAARGMSAGAVASGDVVGGGAVGGGGGDWRGVAGGKAGGECAGVYVAGAGGVAYGRNGDGRDMKRLGAGRRERTAVRSVAEDDERAGSEPRQQSSGGS